MENLDKIILVLGLITTSIIAAAILIKIISRSKKDIEGAVQHGNSKISLKVTSGKEDNKADQSKTQLTPAQSQLSINDQNFDLDKLSLHRFFTTVVCQYTTDICIFNLYDETLRIGVINDTEEVANFKKLLASRYLHLCLFKVLGEHVKQWIDDLVAEAEKIDISSNKIPSTFYTISQYITKYKTEAYKEGKTTEFKYNDKVIYGIPAKFMTRFNEWSDSKMVRVYNMISDVLYSTQNTWFAKTIELLDLFEVIFIMLQDQMDATLIILNGEVTQYLKSLKEEDK
jgi:hypothetical protein